MVQTICYRVGQFLRALTARVSGEEVDQATGVLTPEARALFRRQAVQDQRHALAVCRVLRRAGYTNPHLLAAALLHDVGKATTRLPAWQRAVIVLLGRFAGSRDSGISPSSSMPSIQRWEHAGLRRLAARLSPSPSSGGMRSSCPVVRPRKISCWLHC
jgi:hypothetical protein